MDLDDGDDPLQDKVYIMAMKPPIAWWDCEASAAYSREDGALESGSDALELLSNTSGTRTCCFGTVMKDDRFFFWHYDACGIIYDKHSISLLDDFETVAAIVIAIAGCTPER